MNEEPQDTDIKVVVVGNNGVGKTTLITKTTGRFPEGYLPTAYDNLSRGVDLLVDERPVTLALWDILGMFYLVIVSLILE